MDRKKKGLANTSLARGKKMILWYLLHILRACWPQRKLWYHSEYLKQGRKDAYDIKYIHNIKVSPFKQLWSREHKANQTLQYLKSHLALFFIFFFTWPSYFHFSEIIPLLLLQEHYRTQERETDLSCLTSPVIPQAIGEKQHIPLSSIYHFYFHRQKLLLRL